MTLENRRTLLLKKMKATSLKKPEKSELKKLLLMEKKTKELQNDTWGALVIVGLLYFLEKK